MCSHVPNKGEQMVRYYGYYSNVSRGRRKKADQDGLVPCILQPEESSKEYRKNWARLIQKIYEIDPLICPRCHGPMRVISFIEDQEVIKKILKHLGLGEVNPPEVWRVKPRPPPRMAKSQPLCTEPWIDYSAPRSLLSITGFMWTPYTRRTSCHEPRNRNRDAAWRVISALFHSKGHLSSNLTPRFPSSSRWTIPGRNTPVHRNTLVPNMMHSIGP